MAATRNTKLRKWEHPKSSGIYIREIINVTQGEMRGVSYLVTIPSKLTGGSRIRKQFSKNEEAENYSKEIFEGKQKQGENFFTATDAERNELTQNLPRLRKHGITLSQAVDFAIERLRPEGGAISVSGLVQEKLQSKRIRFERGDLRESSFRDFRNRVEKFSEVFGEMPLHELTCDQIKDWLIEMESSPRTAQNYLAVVSELMKHGLQKRYLAVSPVDEFTDDDRKEICGSSSNGKQPAILTPDEAERLILAAYEYQDLQLLGAITLGLFCGIRTEELKRLRWRDVKDNQKSPIVSIGHDIAKKRRIRNVSIPENALLWLSLCKRSTETVVENKHTNDYQKRFRKLLKLGGFGHTDGDGKYKTEWKNNAMRHSFGSYHYGLNGDPLETSRLLGHKASDQVLFDHYRALTDKEQAEKYFGIVPPATANKVVEFAS
jgi:integrase